MPEKTFAGDRSLALEAALTQDATPEKIIGFLQLTRDCMNPDSVISGKSESGQSAVCGRT